MVVGEDDVCPITNLPRYRCDHCTDTDPRSRAKFVRTAHTNTDPRTYGKSARTTDTTARYEGQFVRTTYTTARYRGHCAYCDDPINPGDPIRRVSNTMDWIHSRHDLDA